MFFTINIRSKNLKSINNFLRFLENEKIFNKLRLKFFKVLSKTKTKKKILTILKSPHVNKTAQEQFESRLYKRNLLCFTEQPFLILLIFKIFRFKYFSDIHILIKFRSNLVDSEKFLKQNINFYFYNLKKKKIIDYLKFLEITGEFLVNKNLSLDSSVG